MELAVLMIVCEGEENLAWDTLASLAEACSGARISLFLIDDASPTHIGMRLAERFRNAIGHSAQCYELPHRLGFYGLAQRLFRGLRIIAQSDRSFDMVMKIDADVCIVRKDLLSFLKATCAFGSGLYGELYPMRTRDRVLLLADYLPLGFARERHGDVIRRRWQLRRLFPVWWSDFGWRALMRGFRLEYVAGNFYILGGKTLRKLDAAGWLERDQTKSGFVFSDDVLLTIAVYALGDPVVDLRSVSSHWGFLATTEEDSLERMVAARPYVVHHLKDRPKAWERRKALRASLGWSKPELGVELVANSSAN
jgi:hypothetical protein